MLPAGVDTRTPSPTNFFIIIFFPNFNLRLAVCLLCLNKETSLIAIISFLVLFLLTAIKDKKRRINLKLSRQDEIYEDEEQSLLNELKNLLEQEKNIEPIE